MNIEDILLPNRDTLRKDGETATATILDIELDALECAFNYDECVVIDTEKYSYITLSLENLASLKSLILEAEDYYDNLNFDEL